MEAPTPTDPPDRRTEDARHQLAALNVQVEAMRAVLVRLLQDVVSAESLLAKNLSAQIVEANEQLVLSALRIQSDADDAAEALLHATRPSELDALTQLPNRSTLLDRFGQALAGARRNGQALALLFVDLDNFKPLNDRLGHAFGDQVLRWVGERLVTVVRAVDTVSRHGGDEFLILLTDLSQRADAGQVAQKLIDAIADRGGPGAQDTVGRHAIGLTASIGIALYPFDGDDIETLVARADAAMYRAKRQGPGRFAFFSAGPGEAPAQPEAPDAAASLLSQDGHTTVTLRRQDDLRLANEQLVLATLDARDLQQAAELARRRQSAMLKAMAAELEDPQAPIRVVTSMLGRLGAEQSLLPRARSIVEQQLSHMSRLVGNVIDASQLGADGLLLERQAVDMRPLIADGIAAYQPLMAERRQHFEANLPKQPMAVNGDAKRLSQVLYNLLNNASKHTHDGGHIRLQASVTEHEGVRTLTLVLADDGIGITPEMLPHVFDPFVQDAHALGFNGTGIGIGLTVARALLQAHGGSLVACSEGAGLGSQFIVHLPLLGPGGAGPADDPAGHLPDSSLRWPPT